MEDKDLFEIWQGGDKQEQEMFEKNQGHFEEIAKQQSNDIFKKIKRNIITEAVLSVIAAIWLPIFFAQHQVFFWVSIIFMIVALGVGIKVYYQYLRDMKELNDVSLLASLAKKQAILARYVKQLKFYLYIFTPIGFVLGFSFALVQDVDFEATWARIGFLILFATPFLFLTMWLGKKYVDLVYVRHLNRINEIYEGLK